MQVLQEAKEQGLCRFTGITADNAEELACVLAEVEVDACLVAYDYTLLCRRALRRALPLASEREIAYIAAGVFNPIGAPEMRSPDARLNEIQKVTGLSLVTLTVRYLVADPAITTILVGASTPVELEESVAAAEEGPLPPDLHEALKALAVP
jgi:D-threo-aldose 1-dehydrogenase